MPARIHVGPNSPIISLNNSFHHKPPQSPIKTPFITSISNPKFINSSQIKHKLTLNFANSIVNMDFDSGSLSPESCRTPKRSGYRGPVKCPAAPKKKAVELKQKKPPVNGYFQSPEIDVFFAMVCRREACA